MDIQARNALRLWLNGASLAALGVAGAMALPHQASAQEAPIRTATAELAAGDQAGGTVSDVVVTSSRIVRDGFEAPTPVSVVPAEEIERSAKVNIADMLYQLPALAGMSHTNTTTVSAGQVGVQSPNLRNLGITRTLVLLDGQRLPAATTGMLSDLNTVPNSLVKRIDVVTGGASAQWGSDAVGGVINFVLDKDYTGFKGDISGGMTTYGDGLNFKIALTSGLKFAGGRGHFLISAENVYDDGVGGLKTRDWYRGAKMLNNPAFKVGNGQPYWIFTDRVGYTDTAPGFIVSAGPLNGLLFGPGGTTSQVKYDLIGGHWGVGGDWRATDFGDGPQQLMASNSRQNVFTRLSYDVTDHINVYGQFMYGRSHSKVLTTPNFQFGNLTIQIDNAYLPASVVQAMQAANVTSLRGGSYIDAVGGSRYDSERQQYRYTLGANGDFRLLSRDWKFNAYWNKNVAIIDQRYRTLINANFTRALDAVKGPNGAVVCRSTLTNPTDGCVPFNILGTGVATPAAIEYVQGVPTLHQQLTQEVFQGNISGEPFNTWAGPVSVAFGLERRREAGKGTSDPLSKVNSYWAGNYKPIIGSYNVTEGYAETVVPLLKDSGLGKSLDFNGAVRLAHYSSSGSVVSWKVGATYAPIEDIRLRVTRSRDIRAGNLAELYQPGQTLTGTFTNPWLNNISQTFFYTSVGNTTIAPEKANTWDIGAVIQPRWTPGLSFSVDYWDIKFKDQISSIGLAALLQGCFDKSHPEYCQFVTLDGANNIVNVNLKPVNLGRVWTNGIDFEASYRFALAGGQVNLRALATRYLVFKSNSELPGAVDSFNGVGANGSLPSWRGLLQASYTKSRFTGMLTGRWMSAGNYQGRSYVACTSACPAYDPNLPVTTANTNRPTINTNRAPGALYFDLSLNYKFMERLEGYFVSTNIANKDPAQFNNGTGIGSQQTAYNGVFYDVLGRTFRAGLRFKY